MAPYEALARQGQAKYQQGMFEDATFFWKAALMRLGPETEQPAPPPLPPRRGAASDEGNAGAAPRAGAASWDEAVAHLRSWATVSLRRAEIVTFLAAGWQKRSLLDNALSSFDEAGASIQSVLAVTAAAAGGSGGSGSGSGSGNGGDPKIDTEALPEGLLDIVAKGWFLRARCEADKGVLHYMRGQLDGAVSAFAAAMPVYARAHGLTVTAAERNASSATAAAATAAPAGSGTGGKEAAGSAEATEAATAAALAERAAAAGRKAGLAIRRGWINAALNHAQALMATGGDEKALDVLHQVLGPDLSRLFDDPSELVAPAADASGAPSPTQAGATGGASGVGLTLATLITEADIAEFPEMGGLLDRAASLARRIQEDALEGQGRGQRQGGGGGGDIESGADKKARRYPGRDEAEAEAEQAGQSGAAAGHAAGMRSGGGEPIPGICF